MQTTVVSKGAGLFDGGETTKCVNGDCHTVKEEGGGLIKGLIGGIAKIFHLGDKEEKKLEDEAHQLGLSLLNLDTMQVTPVSTLQLQNLKK